MQGWFFLAKQLFNFPGIHVPERVIGSDKGLGQFRFELPELVYFFFDASPRNHPVNKYIFILPYAVGMVEGLRFGRGIPPEIHNENITGCRQG